MGVRCTLWLPARRAPPIPVYPLPWQRLSASSPRPPGAYGALGPWTVATRQSEGLLRVRGQVGLRTPASTLSGRYRTSNPSREGMSSTAFEAAEHPFLDRSFVRQRSIAEQGREDPNGFAPRLKLRGLEHASDGIGGFIAYARDGIGSNPRFIRL